MDLQASLASKRIPESKEKKWELNRVPADTTKVVVCETILLILFIYIVALFKLRYYLLPC